MIRFKKREIEQMLEDRKPEINLTTYQHIKKTSTRAPKAWTPIPCPIFAATSNVCPLISSNTSDPDA